MDSTKKNLGFDGQEEGEIEQDANDMQGDIDDMP